MNLTHRKSAIITPDASSTFTPAAAYTVIAYEVGAIAASASSGTTATVDAGHGFATNDYVMLNPGADNDNGHDGFVLVSGTSATTLTLGGALVVAKGDVLLNMGPDTATGGTPDYDGSGVTIYSDMDGGDTITDSVVSADTTGTYEYWHKGGDIWELIRNGSRVPVGWQSWSGSIVTPTSSTDNGLVTWDGTSGRKVQDTGVTVDDSNNLDVPGTITVDGASTLTGAVTATAGVTGLSFTPATPSTAYTGWDGQPTDRAYSAASAVAVTDSSGGSTDGTVAAVSGSGADADINNNFAEVAEEVNALILDVNELRKQQRAILADLATIGLLNKTS